MAKGYWIAHVEVKNADGYKKYVEALPEAMRKYGARYLTRGGKSEVVEGACKSRNVVIEFPSYEAALACYRSADYAPALKLRMANADADLVILEGYDGPQPSDN